MPRKAQWPPVIMRHSSGQARVKIHGRDIYLGKFGSEEAKQAYARLIVEAAAGPIIKPRDGLTVGELAAAYLQRSKEQVGWSQLARVEKAFGSLIAIYGDVPAVEFGPRSLEALQVHLAKSGFCRPYVNSLIGCIKTGWRWAGRAELIPPERWHALSIVPGIPRGHPLAREPKPVTSVSPAVIEATLPYCPAPVAAAVRLQLFTGCRPGESLGIRPMDICMDGTLRLHSGHVVTLARPVWVYSPASHKNTRKGIERHILLGPRCQELLKPFLDREPSKYCFCPREAGGRTRLTPGRERMPGDCYRRDSYTRCIELAARRAGVEHWSPGQIRHTVAAAVWSECDPEVAQQLLGHSSLRMTEHYAKLRDLTLAAEAAEQRG